MGFVAIGENDDPRHVAVWKYSIRELHGCLYIGGISCSGMSDKLVVARFEDGCRSRTFCERDDVQSVGSGFVLEKFIYVGVHFCKLSVTDRGANVDQRYRSDVAISSGLSGAS